MSGSKPATERNVKHYVPLLATEQSFNANSPEYSPSSLISRGDSVPALYAKAKRQSLPDPKYMAECRYPTPFRLPLEMKDTHVQVQCLEDMATTNWYLQARVVDLKAQLDDACTRLALAQGGMRREKAARSARDALQVSYDSLVSRCESLDAISSKTLAELEEKQQSNARLATNVSRLLEENDELREQARQADTVLTDFKIRHHRLEIMHRRTTMQLPVLTDDTSKDQQEVLEVASVVSTAQELESTKKELKDVRRRLNDTKTQLSDLKAELIDTRAQLAMTRENWITTERELDDTKRALTKARRQSDVDVMTKLNLSTMLSITQAENDQLASSLSSLRCESKDLNVDVKIKPDRPISARFTPRRVARSPLADVKNTLA